jgi:hypothetical protein
MATSLDRAKAFLKTSAPRPKNEQGGEQAMFDAAVALNDAISNFLSNPPDGTDPGVLDSISLLQETIAGALDELLAPMIPEQPQQGGLEPTTMDQYPGMNALPPNPQSKYQSDGTNSYVPVGESRHSRGLEVVDSKR